MDEEASEHGDAVPAQLLPQRARVLHVQDLSCHQEDDSEWKVPERTNRHPNDESVLTVAPEDTSWSHKTSGVHPPRSRNMFCRLHLRLFRR